MSEWMGLMGLVAALAGVRLLAARRRRKYTIAGMLTGKPPCARRVA